MKLVTETALELQRVWTGNKFSGLAWQTNAAKGLPENGINTRLFNSGYSSTNGTLDLPVTHGSEDALLLKGVLSS